MREFLAEAWITLPIASRRFLSVLGKIRHLPRRHFFLPLIQQRPGNRAGAEVGHVLVLRQPVDRLLQNAIVAAEDRAVAGEQELGIVLDDALQALDEVGQVGAVMSVDDADAAVLVDVVAAKEQVAQLEGELQTLLKEATAQGITIPGVASSSFTFTRNLTMGSKGLDVAALEHYLNTHGFPVVSTSTYAGSLGYETQYFGVKTQTALARFQASNGIPSTGFFGPITRGWVNGHE